MAKMLSSSRPVRRHACRPDEEQPASLQDVQALDAATRDTTAPDHYQKLMGLERERKILVVLHRAGSKPL